MKVSADLEALLDTWTQSWLGGKDVLAITLEAAGQSIDMAALSAFDWHEYRHAEHQVFFALSTGFASSLAAVKGWGGTRAKSDDSRIWKEVVKGAVESLACELISCAGAQSSDHAADTSILTALQARWFSRGSGHLVARISLDAGYLYFIITPALASAWAGSRSPVRASGGMETRISALKAQRVGIDVVADTMEVSLGEIQNLAKGNVILLKASMDQSFDLRNGAGALVGRGYLADVDGHKAVQLAQTE